MKLPERFISCDWGTSNLRLQLVETDTMKVLSEYKSDHGIKRSDAVFREQNQWSREQFFLNCLMDEMNRSGLSNTGEELIVASGMLSSSLGMREMNYVEMPVSFSGKELYSHMIPLGGERKLLLISGARTGSDVMRGEETQAIGLSNYLPQYGKGILVLPGTHSKHLLFDVGHFKEFSTYMTGEVFDLLANQSVLASVMKMTDWRPSFEATFLKGVSKGIGNLLMTSLFSIRAGNLIYNNSTEENYYYLSGLLIGSELSDLQNRNETIYLAASGNMHELYRIALESFLSMERIVCFDPGLVDGAVLSGQKKILEAYVD